MKLTKIKTAADVLEAIRANEPGRQLVEVNTVDGTVKGVRIGSLHIGTDSYSFAMHRETAGEEADRFRLTATIKGFAPAISYHESEYQAESAGDEFPSGTETAVEPVRVLLNDAGEVVREITDEPAPTAPADDADDLPF